MNALLFYCPQLRVCQSTRRWLCVLFMYGSTWAIAQAQATTTYTNWYFGAGAGVTFAGGTLQALTDGKLQANEGCASISDANGQLLFYTDGRTIWNRMHAVMPGATDLGRSTSSTQAALIVPYQNSAGRFFVFSVGSEADPTGVQYAIVNMTLEGGLGGLETKNKVVLAPSTEKVTTINHCNNLNHWVITHEKGNDVFRVNLLNDNGLIPTATTYRVGSVHTSGKGYMKPSHDGRKLAVAVSGEGGFLEVFDFDNKTGVISNPAKLAVPEVNGAYGLEFSPDNKQLYVTSLSSKTIYQVNVQGVALQATLPVQSQPSTSPGIGALQLGPDGKIYGAIPGSGYLMAINQPNQSGSACGLVAQAVYLGGKTAQAGLPFVLDEVRFLPPGLTISLTKQPGCNAFVLESHPVNLDPAYLTYQWYVNGVAVTGGSGPTLKPTQSGTYTLKVRETKCRDLQQFSNDVPVTLVDANPTATATPDSCGTFRLVAHASGGTVLWTGPGILPASSQLDSLLVSAVNGTQTYQVRVRDPADSSCSFQKAVTVTFRVPPAFQLSPAVRSVCGDTLNVNATPTSDWDNFQWELPDGRKQTSPNIVARQSGLYRLTARGSATGCKSEATVSVTLNPVPVFQLAVHRVDTCLTNAPTGTFLLTADARTVPGSRFTWAREGRVLGNSQGQAVDAYGTYTVTVQTPAGCQTQDSVRVVSTCPPVPPMISLPDAFTPNGDGMNEKLVIFAVGVDQVSLSVYNRWGEVLYAGVTDAPDPAGWETWDGTYKGQAVEGGVYTYRMETKSASAQTAVIRRGTIQVIR